VERDRDQHDQRLIDQLADLRVLQTPWLGPVFWARSLRVKHRLAKLIAKSFESRSDAV
jgi:hypothetical protein